MRGVGLYVCRFVMLDDDDSKVAAAPFNVADGVTV